MNLMSFFSSGINLFGTFNPIVGLLIFLLCFIGEAIGLSVPYLLEATWLLAGCQVSSGVLPFTDLLFLVLMSQLGREVGAMVLYSLSRGGSALLAKYKNFLKLGPDATVGKLLRKVNLLSPFSVAMGRLLWLRIPLTLILGAQRKLKVLLLGIMLSSLVFDGTFIILGAIVGTTTKLKPIQVIPYFLIGLTTIYVVTFVVQRFIDGRLRQRQTGAS